MRNGHACFRYNVNVATCSDFIIGSYISSDRNDVHTLIPFMEQLQKNYEGRNIGLLWWIPVAKAKRTTAGFEAHPETELYKTKQPRGDKHRKYRTDISRRENMAHDAQETPIPVPMESCCKEHGKRKNAYGLGA